MVDTQERISIYTDGSTLKNPGEGGWASIIIENGVETVLQGYDPATTNNRMELQAVISGLSYFKEPTKVTIYCDSAYIVNCFFQRWYLKWRKNSWTASSGKPVENQDLWIRLLTLAEKHDVIWQKVKGHADNVIHNRCDVLAREAAKNKEGITNGVRQQSGNSQSDLVGS